MNVRRGLFRFWILATILFVAAVAFTSYGDVRRHFEEDKFFSSLKAGGYIMMLPISCTEARGREDYDFKRSLDGFCWYELPKFRAVYPEYSDMTDEKLIVHLYRKFNVPIKDRENPWTFLGEKVGIAIGIPLAVLVAGWALLWALAGFSTKP